MLAGVDGRVFELFGGVNGRYVPPLPFCTEDAGVPTFLVTGLLISRPPELPALGFCIVPAFVPRATLVSPFVRPPAGTPVM